MRPLHSIRPILLAASVVTAANASAPAGPVNSEAFPRQEKLEEFRILAPPYVYREDLEVRVQAPPNWSDKIGGPTPPALILSARKPGKPDRSLNETLHFEKVPETRPRKADARPLYVARAGIAVADWPDGPVELSLSEKTDDIGKTPPTLASLTVQRMKHPFDGLTKEADAELRTWIDEANENRPIWGRLPSWRNLAGILGERASGGKDVPPSRQQSDPFSGRTGFLLRSYPNEILGRRQPYTVYVPPALDLSRPAPLMILLHGSGGDYRNIIADEFAGQRFDKFSMLIANAGAFKHQEYRHMAFDDVERIIEDMCKKYHVNRDRIYLQGISLGGRGALEMAALRPDLFAAVSAQGVYGVQETLLDPAAVAARDPVFNGLAARSDMRTWTPNLRNIPVEILYGWRDINTPPQVGLLIGDSIRLAGGSTQMLGFDADHNISWPAYDWARTREWFLQHKRNPDPDLIVQRVSNLRYGKNASVEIRGLHDYSQIGEFRIGKRRPPNSDEPDFGTIASRNVSEVWLATDRFHLENHDLVGLPQPTGHPAAKDGILRLLVSPSGKVTQAEFLPRATAESRVDKSQKYPGRSGPIWDVFRGPVLYVVDKAATGTLAGILKESAGRSRIWDINFGSDKLPMKTAGDVTEEDLKTRNIILFTANADAALRGSLAAKIKIPDLPREEGTAVSVVLRPSPWSENHYVLVVSFDKPELARAFNLHDIDWWDLGIQGDWVQCGFASGHDPGRPFANILSAGVFDHHWQPGAHCVGDFSSQSLLGPAARGE